ncbi:hypothetical protein GOP47_0011122, partial [Adiantum capillus-veneris]
NKRKIRKEGPSGGSCSGGEGQVVVPREEGAISGMQAVSTEVEMGFQGLMLLEGSNWHGDNYRVAEERSNL